MCIVHVLSDLLEEFEPLAGVEVAGGLGVVPSELVGALTEGACGVLTGLDAPAVEVPAAEMHNSSPGRAESSSCDSCAALICRHPAPDAAFVTPGVSAGPDTGVDEPTEESEPLDPDRDPEGLSLAGACSVGGGASVVRPPEDFAEDPGPLSSELTGELVDPELEELDDAAGSEFVVAVPLVASVGLGETAATAAELLPEVDESGEEPESELPEPLGADSELCEELESFSFPPLPFLLGASAVCWDNGVVWPNWTVSAGPSWLSASGSSPAALKVSAAAPIWSCRRWRFGLYAR